MASSRYSRSPSSRKNATKPAAAPAKADEDDVSVELPEDAGTFSEEAYAEGDAPAKPASSGANRSASSAKNSRGSRSSKRMSATSDKKSSRRAALTPEEKALRRRGLVAALKLALGLIVLVGGGFAVWWFLVRDNPKLQQAKAVVSDIRSDGYSTIDKALELKEPDKAAAAIEAAKKKLEAAPEQQRPEVAAMSEQVKAELAERETRLQRVRRDVAVDANLRTLQQQFARLMEPETDLAELDKQARAFADNPVNPGGSRSEDYRSQYSPAVNQIETKLSAIESERTRRKLEAETTPVEQARGKAKGLVEQGKYHEALATIDEAARKFPQANFTALRAWVEEDAQKNWAATKSVVLNLYADYDAIGSAQATRKEALEKAQARLKYVIENNGIDQYVAEAKELLAKYPQQ